MRKVSLIQPAILLLCGLLLCNPSGPAGDRQDEASGTFEFITIAVDAERGIVSGCFESHTGWDNRTNAPRFNCLFFFSGNKAGVKYPITIWQPGISELTNGWLRFTAPDDGSQLHLKLSEIPSGCGNVYPFDLEQGDYFARQSRQNWLEIRIVSAAKAYFHTRAESATRENRYVVQNDVIKILSRTTGWVLAEYLGDTTSTGWLKSSDLYPLAPQDSP